MLDFNHQSRCADHLNTAIDAALVAQHAATPPRCYLGGSRLGHPCERALQFEFTATPKDAGAGFDGRLLRIFGIGHALEDLAVAWLRGAGFDLHTHRGGGPDGEQFGFSVAGGRVRGHVDGILAGGPGIPGMAFPALWGCKTMNAEAWREAASKGVAAAKPIYAVQIAVCQAYMDAAVPGVAEHPARFTAINKGAAELHHEAVPFDPELAQRMGDRAVRVLRATDAGELLPRVTAQPGHRGCRFCPWANRCWGLPA
jgi:hypothetical protein